jgi:carbamoyltransferase
MKILKCENEEEFITLTATYLYNDKVVGWLDGPSEYGPRALGARSILANPARKDIKDHINQKIKYREAWRPFAPIVLEEYYEDWFDLDRSAPYMLLSAQVEEHQRSIVPGITHEDGSSRPQTVSSKQNPRIHRLLTEFYNQTSCPMLLNTSFNAKEPIVETPQDAINTFISTNLDVLAMGLYIIEKTEKTEYVN